MSTTLPTIARNRFETAARSRKAIVLADFIEAAFTPEAAEALEERGRVAAASLAGVRPPSATTWALVVSTLRARRAQVSG